MLSLSFTNKHDEIGVILTSSASFQGFIAFTVITAGTQMSKVIFTYSALRHWSLICHKSLHFEPFPSKWSQDAFVL